MKTEINHIPYTIFLLLINYIKKNDNNLFNKIAKKPILKNVDVMQWNYNMTKIYFEEEQFGFEELNLDYIKTNLERIKSNYFKKIEELSDDSGEEYKIRGKRKRNEYETDERHRESYRTLPKMRL